MFHMFPFLLKSSWCQSLFTSTSLLLCPCSVSLSLSDSVDSDLELSMVRHQPEGLEQLQAQTKFTRKELQSLYRGFKNVRSWATNFIENATKENSSEILICKNRSVPVDWWTRRPLSPFIPSSSLREVRWFVSNPYFCLYIYFPYLYLFYCFNHFTIKIEGLTVTFISFQMQPHMHISFSWHSIWTETAPYVLR